MLKQTMYETLGIIGGDSSFELLLDAFKSRRYLNGGNWGSIGSIAGT